MIKILHVFANSLVRDAAEVNRNIEPTLMKPISAAFSRKHWRQMFRPYLRIIPWLLLQTRL